MANALTRRRLLALLGSVPLGLVTKASAADWPTQPIRVLVGFPPGGTSDVVMRIVAERLSPALGVPVVIDNKPGASGQVATEAGARAVPDGQTILLGSSSAFNILPNLRKKLPYDPAKDFAPLGSIAEYIGVAAVNKDSGIKTLKEFVDAATKSPGKFSYGTAGIGTSGHVTTELFCRATGIKMLHVPFKGSADAMTGLLGGQIDFLLDGVAAPFVKDGRAQGLFVFSSKRRADLPNVLSITELGVPVELPAGPTYALFAPVKTPAPIVATLSKALEKSMADPGVQEKLNASGNSPVWLPPNELAASFDADRRFFGKLLTSLGVRAEE